MRKPIRRPLKGEVRSGGGGPLTVHDLREAIEEFDDDAVIDFGSTEAGYRLVFHRFKRRGDDILQIELNEEPYPARSKSSVQD